MLLWKSAAIQLATKLESIRTAEEKLLSIAKSYSSRPYDTWEIKTIETNVPRSVLSLKQKKDGADGDYVDDEMLTIHSVHVSSSSEAIDPSNSTTDTPLVLLHGYMNAGESINTSWYLRYYLLTFPPPPLLSFQGPISIEILED
jgi:hypothetical protein